MGRGNGEFIATTHCGGGGGGRADDIFKRCQRESDSTWPGENVRWVGVGRRSQSGRDDGSCQEVSAACPLPLRLAPRFSFPSASLSHSLFLLHPTPPQFAYGSRLCPVNDPHCLQFPRPGHSRGAVNTLALFSTSRPRPSRAAISETYEYHRFWYRLKAWP